MRRLGEGSWVGSQPGDLCFSHATEDLRTPHRTTNSGYDRRYWEYWDRETGLINIHIIFEFQFRDRKDFDSKPGLAIYLLCDQR